MLHKPTACSSTNSLAAKTYRPLPKPCQFKEPKAHRFQTIIPSKRASFRQAHPLLWVWCMRVCVVYFGSQRKLSQWWVSAPHLVRFCFNCGENYSSIRSIRGCEADSSIVKSILKSILREPHPHISSVHSNLLFLFNQFRSNGPFVFTTIALWR